MIQQLRKISPFFDRFQNYPYIYQLEFQGSSLKFELNNNIEDFRIRLWGGEKPYISNIVNTLEQDEIFYDIGTSVGLVSVLAAFHLKKGKVIGFEPDPENFKRLEKNLLLNNLTNFQGLQIAVGEKREDIQLYTAGSGDLSPSLRKVNRLSDTIEVEVHAIDDLLKEKKIPPPDSIKIDIEGAEYWALKGMQQLLLSENKPGKIFLEIHPLFLPAFDSSTTEVFKLLLDSNYKIEELISRQDQILAYFKD